MPTGEQVLAPFAFVSDLAGALLVLELARFKIRQAVPGRQELPLHQPVGATLSIHAPHAAPHSHMRLLRPDDDT